MAGRCTSLSLLCVLAITLGATGAHAQSRDKQHVEQWVRDAWNNADGGVRIEYARFIWRAEHDDVPSSEELQRLRRRVRGHPEHPDRALLETYERRIADGPDIERWDVWFGKAGMFRRNLEEPDGSINDIAVSSRRAWSYSDVARQLNIIEDTRSGYPKGYNYGPWEHRLRSTVSGFLHGAFSIRVPGVEMDMQDFSYNEGIWSCVFSSSEPDIALRLEGEGEWKDGQWIGRATSATVEASGPSPDEIGRRWVFTDWAVQDAIGSDPICTTQIEYRPDGRPVTTLHLESVTRLLPSEFEEALAPPDPETKTDAVRGRIPLDAVQRFPDAERAPVVTKYTDSGSEEKTNPASDQPASRFGRFLHRGAFVAVTGGVLLVLGFVLFRRKHAS